MAWPEVLDDAQDLNAKLVDAVPFEDGPAGPDHSSLYLIQWKNGRLAIEEGRAH